jgi:dTDP-glucose 4,6-dehydratase
VSGPRLQNILVTGGAGFIGSNFVQYMLNNQLNSNIVNLDALTYAGSLENLTNLPYPDRYTFIKGDIRDSDLVEGLLRKFKIDSIVHFAAETHVDRSILGPAEFVQTNIIGTFTLLEAVRKVWKNEQRIPLDEARFHHVSTDEVYGTLTPTDAAFTEIKPYAPNSPYAASKAASDHLVRSYFHTYDVPMTITNCSNNYGPRQYPEKLIPLMIMNAKEGLSLPIYGDGKQIRDWLYVFDHCEAIDTVLKNGKLGETYNIGGNNQPTNVEIINALCDLLDELLPNSQFIPHASLQKNVKDRPGHDRRYAMNITKISNELGWEPKETLESGLLKTVTWYLENNAWITNIKNKNRYKQWFKRNYALRGEES